MRSAVWGNQDFPVGQSWGCTDVNVEPVAPYCPGGFFHCGIDIDTPIGTVLYAPADGVVGQIVKGILSLQLDDGAKFAMVHIQTTLKGVGTRFIKGAPLALSGNVAPGGGTVIGSGHTHFEVQHRMDWLLGAPGQEYCIATSSDPVSYLEDSDMTPQQEATLNQCAADAAAAHSISQQTYNLLNQVSANITLIQGAVARIEAKVDALPGGSPAPHVHEVGPKTGGPIPE